jgi:hypothetical protein
MTALIIGALGSAIIMLWMAHKRREELRLERLRTDRAIINRDIDRLNKELKEKDFAYELARKKYNGLKSNSKPDNQ